MKNKDFTLNTYRQLLTTLLQKNYQFVTFESWCKNPSTIESVVIMRHDVDLKAINSLKTAQIEASLGIRATYYFRVIPQSNKPEIIEEIVKLGHEIGYHYEDISIFKGNKIKSINHFKEQLEYFRKFYPVKTICMHGSPVSKYDNRDLWKEYKYEDFNIAGEPYFDFINSKDVVYFTDTARMWNGEKYNVRDKNIKNNHKQFENKNILTTFDLINWIETSGNKKPVMITTHPQRWTENKFDWYLELVSQNFKNLIKRVVIKIRT